MKQNKIKVKRERNNNYILNIDIENYLAMYGFYVTRMLKRFN